MTTPMLMTDCPTEETLAAYVDDRLDPATRREVTEHISSCGECRELVMMTTDYQVSETPANVVRGKFGRIAAAAGGLAAAAVLAIFVLRPAFIGPQMDDVRTAAQKLDTRPTVGRLAGDFAYKKAFSPTRGPGDGEENADLLDIAINAKDPHVEGMALLLGESGADFYRDAVAKLEEAYKNARPGDRDEIAIDLAAALLSNWSDEDGYRRALELSDEVLARKQSPEATWNRAAALDYLGNKEAAQAWDDYLKLDATSPWAVEATRRRNDLNDLNANP